MNNASTITSDMVMFSLSLHEIFAKPSRNARTRQMQDTLFIGCANNNRDPSYSFVNPNGQVIKGQCKLFKPFKLLDGVQWNQYVFCSNDCRDVVQQIMEATSAADQGAERLNLLYGWQEVTRGNCTKCKIQTRRFSCMTGRRQELCATCTQRVLHLHEEMKDLEREYARGKPLDKDWEICTDMVLCTGKSEKCFCHAGLRPSKYYKSTLAQFQNDRYCVICMEYAIKSL